MQVFETVMGVVLIFFALFLVVAVLLQNGSNRNLSGAIGGGSDSFFGKGKGKKLDATLNKLTMIISILFAVIVLTLYIIQPDVTYTYKSNPETVSWSSSDYYDSSVIHAEETEAAEEATETEAQS
ncbi:MAG: preprotein translocase subunit SecG [Clostridia bacterium]|nr:preprotein translocase subunit SecG [Clostridia bacterium]